MGSLIIDAVLAHVQCVTSLYVVLNMCRNLVHDNFDIFHVNSGQSTGNYSWSGQSRW